MENVLYTDCNEAGKIDHLTKAALAEPRDLEYQLKRRRGKTGLRTLPTLHSEITCGYDQITNTRLKARNRRSARVPTLEGWFSSL